MVGKLARSLFFRLLNFPETFNTQSLENGLDAFFSFTQILVTHLMKSL